jgi:hypothetical protein
LDLVKPWLLLFCFAFASALTQDSDAIPWEAGRKLRWEDFRGTPPNAKKVAATTASGISYSYQTRGTPGQYRLDYEVTAYFYPHKSWYHRDICDSVVLSHEQLHFDITELYARRMRTLLERERFGPNVKAEVRRIFKRLNRELSEFQARYDRETDFSRDREAQGRWNDEIGRKLSETAGE